MSVAYVYLHGFASSARSRKGVHVHAWLAERGVPITLADLNRPSFEELSIAAMLEHVSELDRALGAERVCLVGSSLGGWTAARWAELHPERVASMVLLCPAFDIGGRWPAIFSPEAVERWRTKGYLLIPDGAGKMVPVHSAFYEEACAVPPYPRATCPTTIVHGTRDDRVPIEHSRRYAREHRDLVTLIETDDGHDLLASLDVIERAIEERFGLADARAATL